MADLFPIFKTDGSRADTICVMSPRDFVFFEVDPDSLLWDFCEANPHVGSLTSIVQAINTELDAQRDLILQSLSCHAYEVNDKFVAASLDEQQRWLDAWVGSRLGHWYLSGWAQKRADRFFGVALADLPQVLLSGMTKDFIRDQRGYTDLMYQKQCGPLATTLERHATRQESNGGYDVEAADYADGRPPVGQAIRGQGDQDRVDLDPGEVRSTVRERSQAGYQAGQDPEAGQGRSEELPRGGSGAVCTTTSAEPLPG